MWFLQQRSLSRLCCNSGGMSSVRLGTTAPLLGSSAQIPRLVERRTSRKHFAFWHLGSRRGQVGPVSFARLVGGGPNTVSESTVSNTELSEFFRPHRLPGRSSVSSSAYYMCAKANSLSLSQNSPRLPKNSVSSLFRNSALERVFRPLPN